MYVTKTMNLVQGLYNIGQTDIKFMLENLFVAEIKPNNNIYSCFGFLQTSSKNF